MRRRVFDILLVLSLVLLAAVLPCYLGKVEVDRMVFTKAGTPPAFGQRIEVDGGRFKVWTYRAFAGPTVGQFWTGSVGFRPRIDHHSIDGFDAHAFPPNAILGGVTYLFSFPLWIIVLPCAVTPLLWLRARRREQIPRGFPVEIAAAAVRTQTGSP
jgi:hypothetical protein